jgi:decaprenyl-phosphate phosphoribosyltransferase
MPQRLQTWNDRALVGSNESSSHPSSAGLTGLRRTMSTLPTPITAELIPLRVRLRAHTSIMRLDHSIKNVFVLPGIIVALSVTHTAFSMAMMRNVLLGFAATTLIACSNYVINEVLDAPFDRLHPIKRNRPAARGHVIVPLAYAQWILMMVLGISLGWMISVPFAFAAGFLWIMGCMYNIQPFRTKDVVYLDVVTESINNPLRMLLGWYMVTAAIVPPTSLLVCYWMIGCFFMALKRFSEYRDIADVKVAGAYRRSFRRYTEQSLLVSITFYASFAMLMFGSFIMRYRLELILSFPLVATMMATYFHLAFRPGSAVQNPEKLYREPLLMAELLVTTTAILLLLFIDLPMLTRLFPPSL